MKSLQGYKETYRGYSIYLIGRYYQIGFSTNDKDACLMVFDDLTYLKKLADILIDKLKGDE